MATERVTMRMRDGTSAEMEAVVRRYNASTRSTTAMGIFGGSVVLGLGTIIIPGVHFVGPWLIPLLGGAIALYLYNRVAIVDGIRGTCPNCSHVVEINEGGPLGNEALWVRCSHCKVPLEFLDPQAEAEQA